MKVVFLTPGLARIKRGYERFALELSAQLRRCGVNSTCWGTSEGPGIESFAVPGRLELQDVALSRLRADSKSPSVPPVVLQDWSLYAEDQLFAVPAAIQIKTLLDRGESLLVYARWQGGLVDPSGAPTELLKVLASGVNKGRASLLVHTDYIYSPIHSLLWSAGASFHSLGPWITEPLLQLSVAPGAIVELPMCIDAAAYRSARKRREATRAKLGIPPDAFVVLSVGSFETTTPDKRHGHILGEIQNVPGGSRIWWIVAGSRGPVQTDWEREARRLLGPRFISITNLAFEEMPGIYGAADLFALASLGETFGLVYLEAQIAGLPVVVHDSPISRHLCAGLPETLAAVSLVGMSHPGAAAAAIARWMALFSNPDERESLRAALDSFSRQQENRFGWESAGLRFAESFRKIARPAPGSHRERHSLGTWDDQLHKQGVRLFSDGKYTGALSAVGKALGARETAERWNDWATIQTALSKPQEAEQGFRRALALEPDHAQAAANLGVVLADATRFADAIPLLERGLPGLDETQQPRVRQILAACKEKSDLRASSGGGEIATLLNEIAERSKNANVAREDVLYCEALVAHIPPASPGQRLLGIGPHGDLLAPAIARLKNYAQVEWRTPQRGLESPSHSHIAIESVPWPFEDGSFDALVLARTLETVASDPMQVFCEINRVLKAGGFLLLTAPNIASAKSLHSLLRGESPYVDGRFPAVAGNLERHSREYTASEIETLASAAGLGDIQMHTQDIFWHLPDALMSNLAAAGFSIGSRGDTIFLRARKESPVRERFPVKLYEHLRGLKSRPLLGPAPQPMRILVAYENLPLLDRGGADYRLMQVIRLLREQGHAVTFLASRAFGKELYAPALHKLGVETRIEDARVLRQEGVDVVPQWTLQEVLREGQFDLAILSLWFWMGITLPEHYLDEIRRLSPATCVAILTDDCHGLRESGRAEISRLWSDRERAVDFAEREMEIHRRADLVICISDSDKRRISPEIGRVPIEILPMMIEAAPEGPAFAEREGLVYLANFNNPASLDGLEWYLREVAPLVRQELPGMKLYLLGPGLPESWSTADPNVVRVGYAPDLAAEFARRRISVSPVRFGTGIKTKNLHALAHGLPIVTNTMGAEGLNFVSGKTALIADDPREFARSVVALYGDAALWNTLSENGRSHARSHFSKAAMDSALRSILANVHRLRPKQYDPAHAWSTRLVENMFREVLSFQPAKERPAIRILAYSRAAEQFLSQGNHEESRRQLRHVFNSVPSRMSRGTFFSGFLSVAESMERTYRALGERQGAAEFRREARLFSAAAFPEPPPALPPADNRSVPTISFDVSASQSKNVRRHPNGNHPSKLDFSVIVPTYNREKILSECLNALDRQSLSRYRFEVIVVDDGSTDATRQLCQAHKPRHEFHYLPQANAGAGAARRLGVSRARGKYLLLINDDTIAAPDLLARHLEAQHAYSREHIAVLGDFCYPEDAKNRALTHFLKHHPFLFPQVTLKPGIHTSHSLFVTCNISVQREAVLAAGSFDPAFRVAEDTDLGIRLIRNGLRVLYIPEAKALHQHLSFTMGDLIRRAEIYGATLVTLYKKHPCLLVEGHEPFGTLDAKSLSRLESFVRTQREEVARATVSLQKFDSIDFVPFFSRQIDGKNAAEEVMTLFSRSIPTVFWYHLLRSFLPAWTVSAELSSSAADASLVTQPVDAVP